MSAVVMAPHRDLALFQVVGPLHVMPLTPDEGNDLLVRWGHDLGPCERLFEQNFYGLVVNARLVSMTCTASLVSPTVTDERGQTWRRNECAELARICTDPTQRWATRPMLRLWREVLVHEWQSWDVKMAVSYASPGKAGHIYRHDGWTFVRQVKRSSSGVNSTWAKGSVTDGIGDGKKGLWVYRWSDRTIDTEESHG